MARETCKLNRKFTFLLPREGPGPPLKARPSKCLKCNTKQSIERQVMCRTKRGFRACVTQWERDE
ncbi:unnamed protein product [Tetraodon nigroviridis]|uniref:(spotted green pufferfish) hypothetical protein n=1 Tax=Tetraodon nigroviridis TaxID=99883 RepID=Q4SSW5_TETNG|nr:unnamed protein product [Tetraodon nigroviridis]